MSSFNKFNLVFCSFLPFLFAHKGYPFPLRSVICGGEDRQVDELGVLPIRYLRAGNPQAASIG
jgi:hypothetical protein